MKTKKKYSWQSKWLAKNVNVNEVLKVLNKFDALGIPITAEILVETARSEDSVLHPLFEWNDSLAAEKYRLQQARTIINNIEVTIVSKHETYVVPVYEIVTIPNEGKRYRSIEVMTYTEIEQVKNQTLNTLRQLTEKLKLYKELQGTHSILKDAINSLS